jgi:hypothetical protein
MSNPLSTIYWLFLPNKQLLARRDNNNENIINETVSSTIEENQNWILLESKTIKTSLNSEAILYRLPYESIKHHHHHHHHQHEIYEKTVQPFYLTSILYIRVCSYRSLSIYFHSVDSSFPLIVH